MSEPLRIQLAGREYSIPPLLIGQARAIDILLAKPLSTDPVALTEDSWDRMLGVVCIALKETYPDVTPEKLLEGPGNVDSVVSAYRVVLGMLGLKPARTEPAPGEASGQPGAAPG